MSHVRANAWLPSTSASSSSSLLRLNNDSSNHHHRRRRGTSFARLLYLYALLLIVLASGWPVATSSSSSSTTAAPVRVRNVSVDVSDNVTLVCGGGGASSHPNDLTGSSDEESVEEGEIRVSPSVQPALTSAESNGLFWIREGREDGQSQRLTVEPNGLLRLKNVSKFDSGFYYCSLRDHEDTIRDRIYVQVRTAPPALQNVWVKPSTILANVLWEVAGTGGYPIIDFTAEYRLKPVPGEEPEDWKSILPNHIPPNLRQIDVYHLEPNTTYVFRVWATNQLGRGEIVEVEGHTHHSIEELELARHLLAGVENFDTRVWVAAVGIVMGTLMVLGFGTCYLLYRECKAPSPLEEQEVIELVPNIILNPGFFDDRGSNNGVNGLPTDENFNSQASQMRLNNNSYVQPRRL
ncbi:hypothetical protein TKK_0012080 [Trichogramma kaykai]